MIVPSELKSLADIKSLAFWAFSVEVMLSRLQRLASGYLGRGFVVCCN